MNRRGDKIAEVEKYLNDLKSFFPNDYNKYSTDKIVRAACERYFEKIVEGIIDLAFLIIKDRGFRLPEYSREAFEILCENNLMSRELSSGLGNAKSMRNWLAHRYGEINDRLVFDSIKNKFISDVQEFLEAVR